MSFIWQRDVKGNNVEEKDLIKLLTIIFYV